MVKPAISESASHRAKTFSRPSAIIARAVLAAACLIVLLIVTLALASAQDGRSEARQSCEADYHRVCTGVLPGGGRIRQCLTEHFDALSGPCEQVISAKNGK